MTRLPQQIFGYPKPVSKAYEGMEATQAALRRSVSTAYYALFHLLVTEAGQRWKETDAADATD